MKKKKYRKRPALNSHTHRHISTKDTRRRPPPMDFFLVDSLEPSGVVVAVGHEVDVDEAGGDGVAVGAAHRPSLLERAPDCIMTG